MGRLQNLSGLLGLKPLFFRSKRRGFAGCGKSLVAQALLALLPMEVLQNRTGKSACATKGANHDEHLWDWFLTISRPPPKKQSAPPCELLKLFATYFPRTFATFLLMSCLFLKEFLRMAMVLLVFVPIYLIRNRAVALQFGPSVRLFRGFRRQTERR